MYIYRYAVTAILTVVVGTSASSQLSLFQPQHWVKRLAAQSNIPTDREPPAGHFDQYIDHDNPQKGTFKQKYWYSDKYYKGPGSPIVLTTPGEAALPGSELFLNDTVITTKFAKAIGGAVVVLEHRYWGYSTPVRSFKYNAETLQHLTLKNAIADFSHFARTVTLPFDKQGKSQASKAPWVFSGGSYSGALVAWTEQLAPGTFWAYHASSAVVQAIYDNWYYFDLIQNSSLGKSCRPDVELGVNYVNQKFLNGTKKEQSQLKALFGLEKLKHADDFAFAMSTPLFYYQSGQNPEFCERLAQGRMDAENSGTSVALGVIKAWAKYFGGSGGLCSPSQCWNTHRPDFVHTLADPQWSWMLCNEPFGWWYASEPEGQQGIVPRTLTTNYFAHQCATSFPRKNGYTYGLNKGRTVKHTNAYTGGYANRRPSKRLVWSNSGYDPWRADTVSSPYRAAGPQVSTKEEPVFFDPTGYHVADIQSLKCAKNDKRKICKIVDAEVGLIKQWVSEFPAYP